jgi:MerR family mercuric resistance operon transcriptional regulator
MLKKFQRMQMLTIGNLAKEANVNVQTVRYYERRRLLPQPRRTPSGYRIYPVDAVQRLHFIKTAQELGFSLKEIQELLGLRLRPGVTSAHIRKRAEAKVVDIEKKIGTLQAMKKGLSQIISACSGCGPLSECPILDSLDHRRTV